MRCFHCAGPGLRINGNRRTATCNVNTHGVLLHGLWVVQAIQWQPKEPTEPSLHLARASLSRKHGFEAKTDKDPCFELSQEVYDFILLFSL